MRTEQALKLCALRYLCGSEQAVGEQQMRISSTAYAYVPLCRLHKELYDLLGEERFRERFGLWLFPKAIKARR